MKYSSESGMPQLRTPVAMTVRLWGRAVCSVWHLCRNKHFRETEASFLRLENRHVRILSMSPRVTGDMDVTHIEQISLP